MRTLGDHLGEIGKATEGLDGSVALAAALVSNVKMRGRRVWILGNGGSLAIAQHFAQDLLKMCGVRAHALACPSQITAYANDQDFQDVFGDPLGKLIDEGDMVFVFSCSGSSRNYHFLKRPTRPQLVAVVGTDGGFLKSTANIVVHVKSTNYQVCETAFCAVADVILSELMGEKN